MLSSNYIETLSPHLARNYLQMTDAIGVMAGGIARDHAQPLHVLPLTLPRLIRPAGVMWNRSRALTPGAELMVKCLAAAAGEIKAKQQQTSAPQSRAAANP